MTGEFDNIYYTDEYGDFLRQSDGKMSDICSEEHTLSLDMGYSLWYGVYAPKGGSGHSCRCRLFSPDGKSIFGYTVHYDQIFENAVKILNTRDGLYFFYREGLYGYSVLRLSDMRQMHYVPRGMAQGGKMPCESFIITNLYYCDETGIAAVEGCFWACPYDVALIDLTDPMKEPRKITQMSDIINPDRELEFDDIDFVRWEKGGRLIVRTDSGEEYAFNANDLREFMK